MPLFSLRSVRSPRLLPALMLGLGLLLSLRLIALVETVGEDPGAPERGPSAGMVLSAISPASAPRWITPIWRP